MAKRILVSISIRIVLILSMILSIFFLNQRSSKVYLIYLLISFFLFLIVFTRSNNTFSVVSYKSRAKINITKLCLSCADFSIFLLLSSKINDILALIGLQLLLHPVKSWIYYHYFFRVGTKIERFLLFPLPVLKEFKWIFIKAVGRVLQKYLPSSRLIQKTLISTTHFFRDTNEYKYKLIEYYRQIGSKPLNILVIGCATGQEAYSIAIICKDNKIDYHIDAFDLSTEAIRKAMIGEYYYEDEISLINRSGRSESLEQIKNYIKYFELSEGKIKVKDIIKRNICFDNQDIIKTNLNKQYDFVFARKMLYYLPKSVLPQVINKIRKSLKNNEKDQNIVIDGYSSKVLRKYFK